MEPELNPPEYYMYDIDPEEEYYDTQEPDEEFREAEDAEYDRLDDIDCRRVYGD